MVATADVEFYVTVLRAWEEVSGGHRALYQTERRCLLFSGKEGPA